MPEKWVYTKERIDKQVQFAKEYLELCKKYGFHIQNDDMEGLDILDFNFGDEEGWFADRLMEAARKNFQIS